MEEHEDMIERGAELVDQNLHLVGDISKQRQNTLLGDYKAFASKKDNVMVQL